MRLHKDASPAAKHRNGKRIFPETKDYNTCVCVIHTVGFHTELCVLRGLEDLGKRFLFLIWSNAIAAFSPIPAAWLPWESIMLCCHGDSVLFLTKVDQERKELSKYMNTYISWPWRKLFKCSIKKVPNCCVDLSAGLGFSTKTGSPKIFLLVAIK